MGDAVCAIVCVCVSFASEVGVCSFVVLPALALSSIFSTHCITMKGNT